MNETIPQAVRWVVTGRVQGVYYRYFTQQAARELGLVGWVRNLPDGSVEVQVAADREQLDQLRQRLREGPPMSRVDEIIEETLSQDALSQQGEWESFEIRY
ncbi:MAG: acylphosphatase [bacterium]|nr:acylphosphatase [bacterium]